MDINQVIADRRSVRKYQVASVGREILYRVLDAARLAPSAANRQPWKLYVVENAALKEKLGQAYKVPWFYEAPTILVMCTLPDKAWKRSDKKNYGDVDATIAFDHITLAAHAEGLGTCWIGAFNPDIVKQILDLPDGEEPLAMTPLGLPAQQPKPTPRKTLKDLVVFR